MSSRKSDGRRHLLATSRTFSTGGDGSSICEADTAYSVAASPETCRDTLTVRFNVCVVVVVCRSTESLPTLNLPVCADCVLIVSAGTTRSRLRTLCLRYPCVGRSVAGRSTERCCLCSSQVDQARTQQGDDAIAAHSTFERVSMASDLLLRRSERTW